MIYDAIVVGGGPAGITAGIYLARANKKVLILEKMAIGGQVAEIGIVENYTGFKEISGYDLSMNMYGQAKSLGVEFLMQEATDFDLLGEIKKIKTAKNTFEAKTAILALGSVARVLNVPNEKKFVGSGISYCATCDGNFFKNKTVAVVGAGDSAISNAQYLAGIVKKLYIISKYSPMKLKNTSTEELSEFKNIEYVLGSQITKLIGEDCIEAVVVNDDKKLAVEGVFVSIGRTPDTEDLKGEIDLDEKGYIIADNEMKTNVDGVFAAGDIVAGSLKQIVTAASSGAIAGTSAIKYINSKK